MTNYGETKPGWNMSGDQRDDGVSIAQDVPGNWVVFDAKRQSLLRTCPCCGKMFDSKRAARRAVDAHYPLQADASDAMTA